MFLNQVTKALFVTSLPLTLAFSYVPVYQFYQPLLRVVPAGEIKSRQFQTQIQKIKFLQKSRQNLQAQIDLIDQGLPGLSTYQVNFWSDKFRSDLSRLDFVSANKSLKNLEREAEVVLTQQEELAKQEEERLLGLLGELIAGGRDILADMSGVEAQYAFLQKTTVETKASAKRLSKLRDLIAEATESIKQRRITMASAIKQIVIKKSELKLLMFENGEELYEMPISLGRFGHGTRSGEFAVLDKLGTVWGVWQIYLPYWMGIYFAGSTENGIHGIPYDRAGNSYWVSDIGVRNVTYGCVMPGDKDAKILYDWAEVGVPVTIIN